MAMADVDRLAQIVANLIENGLRFASAEIRTSVAATDGAARITVEDDGPGIDAVDIPHVFERLYVAHARPRRAESGSGLGLAIVRELAIAMGGAASAEPRPDGGTRLVVTLPLV
jgi:signal transduction histidine kinase